MKARLATCSGCQNVRPCLGGRCEDCRRTKSRTRNRVRQRTRRQPWYDADWKRISKEAREQHVAIYGLQCPVCNRVVASMRDLTTDHVKARSLDEGVRVMCRPCNSSKGAKPQ